MNQEIVELEVAVGHLGQDATTGYLHAFLPIMNDLLVKWEMPYRVIESTTTEGTLFEVDPDDAVDFDALFWSAVDKTLGC